MNQRIKTLFAVLVCLLLVASCTTTEKLGPAYSYSATIWQDLSAKQMFLRLDGTTNQMGTHLGHYLGEAVSITVIPIPKDSVTIGALQISKQLVNVCP